MVSIMPGMENLAPERTLTSSGFVGVAELLPHALFERLERFEHLLVDLRRNGVVVLEVDVADFGGDGEAGRHRQLGPAHLGQPGAFAAERVFHLSVTVGGSVAERVDILLHACLLL